MLLVSLASLVSAYRNEFVPPLHDTRFRSGIQISIQRD